jgi:hypothetical protein
MMDELKTMDEELTTADLAKNGAPKQLEGPRLVNGHEPEALASHPKVVSREMIEKVAYQIWVQRGYQHGYALEDWIAAERDEQPTRLRI